MFDRGNDARDLRDMRQRVSELEAHRRELLRLEAELYDNDNDNDQD